MAEILILVPNGAEFRSVQRALKKANTPSSVQIVAIPAGDAVRDFLLNLERDWTCVKQVVVMGLCGGLTDAAQVGQVGEYVSYQLANKYNKSWQTAPQPPILGEPEIREHFMAPHWGLGGLIQWKAVTIDRVVTTETEKRSLHSETGCDVVDMETFWILDFMQQREIAVTVLRVVSDGIDGDLPDLAQVFDSNGVLQPLALVRAFLRKPVAAVRLIRGSIVALQKLEDCAAMLSESFTI